jgi:hypothetical protein
VALTPTLTRFDERVLAAVPQGKGARVGRIVADVLRGYRHHDHGSYVRWCGCPSRDDIVGVLRGLEHLGAIHQRSGWWRR